MLNCENIFEDIDDLLASDVSTFLIGLVILSFRFYGACIINPTIIAWVRIPRYKCLVLASYYYFLL